MGPHIPVTGNCRSPRLHAAAGRSPEPAAQRSPTCRSQPGKHLPGQHKRGLGALIDKSCTSDTKRANPRPVTRETCRRAKSYPSSTGRVSLDQRRHGSLTYTSEDKGRPRTQGRPSCEYRRFSGGVGSRRPASSRRFKRSPTLAVQASEITPAGQRSDRAPRSLGGDAATPTSCANAVIVSPRSSRS